MKCFCDLFVWWSDECDEFVCLKFHSPWICKKKWFHWICNQNIPFIYYNKNNFDSILYLNLFSIKNIFHSPIYDKLHLTWKYTTHNINELKQKISLKNGKFLLPETCSFCIKSTPEWPLLPPIFKIFPGGHAPGPP